MVKEKLPDLEVIAEVNIVVGGDEEVLVVVGVMLAVKEVVEEVAVAD